MRLPITADYVDFHAARNPRRAALVESSGRVTYAELAMLVRRCAIELQALGVRRGQRVAVAGSGLGLELVLLLAAEGLGAATASFGATDDSAAPALWPHVDWVFCATPLDIPAPARFFLTDHAFVTRLRQPLLVQPPAWTPVEPAEGQRLLRTSGSTGAPKVMLVSRAGQDWWIRCALESWQADRGDDSRVVLLCPLVVSGGFMRAHAVLRQGGSLVMAPPGELERIAPTSVLGLPVHVERLLRELPAEFQARRPIRVGTLGAPAGGQLRDHAATLLGGPVFNRYGCNETGPVCDEVDGRGVGTVRPGVEVRILDGQGRALRPGEQGVIAVRTPAMVDGYLSDSDATGASFRNGWFHTGDIGALLAPRVLRIDGRHDAMLNFGGIKAPATLAESQVAAVEGVAECAVLSVVLDQGLAIGIAVVLAGGAKRDDVVPRVQQAVPVGAGVALAVACLPSLPRLTGGKVDRPALLRIFRGG